MSKPRSRKRSPKTRRNPITRAWALYGPSGLIYRGKPAEAEALVADAYADWKVALTEALRNGDPKKPSRPKFILVSEMSDGSWLEVNTGTGKLVSRKESPQSRLGLQQRIQALTSGVKAFSRGREAIQGFAYASSSTPGVSTAATKPVLGWKTERTQQVALGAAALKTERAAYADGVAEQKHLPIERVGSTYVVPGADEHPGFPSRAVAEMWRKKILHEGPVQLAPDGSGWIVPDMPQIQHKQARSKGPRTQAQVRAEERAQRRFGYHPDYAAAWDAYKAWMKERGDEEKAKKERAQALAQQLAAVHHAKTAATRQSASEAFLPRGIGRAIEYRGLRMLVSPDGWVEIPGLKREAKVGARRTVVVPSVEEAKALIDAAREAQAKRLGKTVANPARDMDMHLWRRLVRTRRRAELDREQKRPAATVSYAGHTWTVGPRTQMQMRQTQHLELPREARQEVARTLLVLAARATGKPVTAVHNLRLERAHHEWTDADAGEYIRTGIPPRAKHRRK